MSDYMRERLIYELGYKAGESGSKNLETGLYDLVEMLKGFEDKENRTEI